MGLGLGSHRCTMTWRSSPFLSGSSFLSSFLSWGILVSGGPGLCHQVFQSLLECPPAPPPEPTMTILPTHSKSGHCGVLLRVPSTLACPGRVHEANLFIHGVLALVLEMTVQGGGVLLPGALGDHLPSLR